MNKNFDNVMDVNEEVLDVLAAEKDFVTEVTNYPSDYEKDFNEDDLNEHLAELAYKANIEEEVLNNIDF